MEKETVCDQRSYCKLIWKSSWSSWVCWRAIFNSALVTPFHPLPHFNGQKGGWRTLFIWWIMHRSEETLVESASSARDEAHFMKHLHWYLLATSQDPTLWQHCVLMNTISARILKTERSPQQLWIWLLAHRKCYKWSQAKYNCSSLKKEGRQLVKWWMLCHVSAVQYNVLGRILKRMSGVLKGTDSQ